jgi:hypothetical protein
MSYSLRQNPAFGVMQATNVFRQKLQRCRMRTGGSECWFSILQGQSLAGASFTSTGQLKAHIDATAEPFVWTKIPTPSDAVIFRRSLIHQQGKTFPIDGRPCHCAFILLALPDSLSLQ